MPNEQILRVLDRGGQFCPLLGGIGGSKTLSGIGFGQKYNHLVLAQKRHFKKMKYVFDAAFRVGSISHWDALYQILAPKYVRSICRKQYEDFLLFSYRKTIEFQRFCSFCLIDLIQRMAMAQNLIFSDSLLLPGPPCKFTAQNIHFRHHSRGPNTPN